MNSLSFDVILPDYGSPEHNDLIKSVILQHHHEIQDLIMEKVNSILDVAKKTATIEMEKLKDNPDLIQITNPNDKEA